MTRATELEVVTRVPEIRRIDARDPGVELGGFVVAGPCTLDEITRRYGGGSYRVSAYGFETAGIRWEVLLEELA